MEKIENIKNITCKILIIIIVPILIINLIILIKSFIYPDEIPGIMGYKPFVVLSGSMEAEIYTGDLAIVKEVDVAQLKNQDIIAYKMGESVIVHRIIEIENNNEEVKFKTKGDNNIGPDDNLVQASQIQGKYLLKISKLGNFIMFLQKPLGMIISIVIPIILIILIQISENKQYKKELEKLQNNKKQ